MAKNDATPKIFSYVTESMHKNTMKLAMDLFILGFDEACGGLMVCMMKAVAVIQLVLRIVINEHK